jgi:uncharacterized protein
MKKNYFPLFFLIYYVLWIIRATWLYSTVDVAISSETWRLIFSNFIKFVLSIIPAFSYVIWVDKENPLEQMKVNTPINRRSLPIIIITSVLCFVIVFLFEYLSSIRTLLPLLQIPIFKIMGTLAVVFFSPIIEEIFFRGFALYQLGKRMSFWKSNIIQAFLFTAAHWPSWIWINGFQTEIVAFSIDIFILAIFLGWVVKKSNSIWLPVVFHIINNLLAAFLP